MVLAYNADSALKCRILYYGNASTTYGTLSPSNLVIDIPAYIRTIGCDAFNDCDNVTNINIPDNSVQTIHSKAFMNTNIFKIYIPECITLIEGNALGTKKSILDIYTDVETPSGYIDEYTSVEGGWLRPGWSSGLGGDTLVRIHYDRSRSYYNSLS